MSRKLEFLELDFDEIKQSLIEFMINKPEFADYDFTGSALNTLMDALAYAVNYTGVYANFSLNEAFLDTAILRKSVVSKAKEIGYVPSQMSGAKSEFKLTFDYYPINNTSGKAVFPRGTRFYANTKNNASLPFVMVDDNYFYENEDTPNEYSGVGRVVQGQLLTKKWTADTNTRYIISQDGVSTNDMIVLVNDIKWVNADNIVEVTPSSTVYYISELSEGVIEIYFGNDILGKSIQDGVIIEVEYLETKGVAGNYLTEFSITNNVFLDDYDYIKYGDITISEIVKSYDGTDIESIESIKFLAPLDYQRQNRVVTIEDYKTAVLSNYNNVEAIHTWGGENNDPPEYGKVFISIKPKTGIKVSALTKTDIETNILSKYGVIGILPEIIDPDYININLDSIVYYNKDQTSLNSNQLISEVNSSIDKFFNESVFDYEASFKYSKLLESIDSTEDSIISNETDITISKFFTPKYNGKATYYISYLNPIIENTIISSEWTNKSGSKSSIKDDGLGYLDLYVNDVLFKRKIGDVDYLLGKISLTSFDAEIYVNGINIYIFAKPVNFNISVSQNNLIILGNINVTMESIEK